jgi:hypothetical protein
MKIAIVILSILSVSFAVAYTATLSALIKANNILTKTIIDKFILQEYIDTVQSGKDIKTDEEIHQESFLNFISESRDWAFDYIETVQSALNKFVAEVDPSIEYFDPLTEGKPEQSLIDICRKIAIKMNPSKLFKYKQNMIRRQSKLTSNCGYHCIHFLEGCVKVYPVKN